MTWLGFDVGGANLKVADGRGYFASQPFALWRQPDRLAGALADLLQAAPSAARVAATMTGELADCFETKAEGVAAILDALAAAVRPRELFIYLVDGTFLAPAQAKECPLLAAAANWHALASLSSRELPGGTGLLIDLGSTTCDVIPLVDGSVAARGRTDPERLRSRELIYTGVKRTPVHALAATLPWRGAEYPVVPEMFATTRDVYLLLRRIPEEPGDQDTADGRPATRACAHARLARAVAADRELFDEAAAVSAAETIYRAQLDLLAAGIAEVAARIPARPPAVVISGEGEFLLREVVERLRLDDHVVSLKRKLGSLGSRSATAHAVAVLAGERIG